MIFSLVCCFIVYYTAPQLAAVQCIVIGPVCDGQGVFMGVFVGLLP